LGYNPPGVFDSHCHLDRGAFDVDRDAVLARARSAGVTDLLVPAVDPDGWDALVAYASGRRGVHAALGIHPQALRDIDPRDDDRHLADLEARLARGGIVAVGECGLDGPTAEPAAGSGGRHAAPLSRQLAVLAGHLVIARRLGLPVVLHSLRASDPMLEILARDGVPSGGVLHSFSGRADQVPALAALGLHFSFAGPLTYEKVRKPVEAARAVPRDRLLVETDAPDQVPRPHRGVRNEPSYLPLVVEALGHALGVAAAEVDVLTTANARRLFRLEAR
jgi:TatD DNase family protein